MEKHIFLRNDLKRPTTADFYIISVLKTGLKFKH